MVAKITVFFDIIDVVVILFCNFRLFAVTLHGVFGGLWHLFEVRIASFK